MHFRTHLDGGAFGSYGLASLYYTGALQPSTYRIPNYKFEGVRVFTNKPRVGPKAATEPRNPVLHSNARLDAAAGPRDRSCHDQVAQPGETVLDDGQIPGDHRAQLQECIEQVVAASGFREMYGRLAPGRGVGLAVGAYLSGAGLPI